MKTVIQVIIGLLVWYLILLGIEKLFSIEWLVNGKYYILGLVLSFVAGTEFGIYLLAKKLAV